MPCLTGTAKFDKAEMEDEVDAANVPNPNAEARSTDTGMECEPASMTRVPLSQLRTNLLDFLAANDKAHFKSQQKDDPELSYDIKRKIAEEVLDRSPAQFLGRFGQFLQKQHLEYFSGEAMLLQSEAYEIGFHLQELERYHCKARHDVDVRNRRYDALQKMLADGNSYFSEDEMRQRNPSLYEHLVGQYLTEEERKERETPDLENISFVNLLLMKISRDETKELKKKQEKEETGNQSESSDSNLESGEEDAGASKNWNERGTWGETADDVNKMLQSRKQKKKQKKKRKKSESREVETEIPDEERLLLMQEFMSTMYKSFIDGNDTDFDYSQVDSNPDYDCIDVRARDEEEKYFDAETPEDEEMEAVSETPDPAPILDGSGLPPPPSLAERKKAKEDEEDSLEAFMKTVEVPVPTSDLTSAFQNLCQQSRVQPSEKSLVFKKSHVIKINLKKD